LQRGVRHLLIRVRLQYRIDGATLAVSANGDFDKLTGLVPRERGNNTFGRSCCGAVDGFDKVPNDNSRSRRCRTFRYREYSNPFVPLLQPNAKIAAAGKVSLRLGGRRACCDQNEDDECYLTHGYWIISIGPHCIGP
jgi:hypothetical protein